MAKLTNYEKETIVNFNDDNDMAEVYTHNSALKRKLDKFCKSHPEIYKLIKESKQWESKTYSFPKKFITFRVPKVMSDESKAKLVERMAKARTEKQI